MATLEVCELLAERFVDSLLRDGAWDDDLYTPNARLWHNTDDQESPLRDAVRSRECISAAIPTFGVVGVEQRAWPGGFVIEFAYAITLFDGSSVRVPACVVGTVDSDRISLVQEYFDSNAMAPVGEALRVPVAG